ncbi:MAG: ribulose-phosphate 3-epimerase [Halanaerobiales bacterium]|nr:ribulose-phosphate 3-epimerase [Halanaerobiales bacterium]
MKPAKRCNQERGDKMQDKISASIMCADLLNLGDDIKELKKAGVDYIHWDIMDGVFVPNYSMNQDFMKVAREITDLKFDTHLMITDPARYIDKFAEAGTDLMVVHAEATIHLHRVVQQIKAKGLKVGVAINPATPVCSLNHVIGDLDLVLVMTVNPGYAGQKMIPATLDKIEEVREMVEKKGLEIDIEVDGNVSFENAVEMKKRGANVFVAGTSSIFHKDLSIVEATRKLRELLAEV